MAEGIEVRTAKNGAKSYRASVWDNRERKRIHKTCHSLAEAKAWRADALIALRQGTLRTPDPSTVREAAEVWLEGAERGTVRDRSGRAYKPSTIRSYREKLTRYVLPALGHYKLSELRRRDVQQLVDELLASDASPSSVRNTLDPLRAIYRRAIQRDQVVINPTLNLDMPSARRKPVRIATPAQARTLLDALPSEDQATWAAAFYAGLRRGELRALRCSDIDLGASTIRVERSWDQHEGPIAPKSDTSTRTVPLLAVLRDYLDEHLICTRRSGDDLMFGRTPADPFVPSTLRHRAIRACEAAGLDAIGLHEARHSFASVLIASDENPKAVQDAMGHSSIKVTYDLYGHLFPGARDELRVRVDRYLEAEAELPDGTTVGQ